MKPTDILLDQAAPKAKIGIDAVADIVKITMGPRGRYVALYNGSNQYPTVTNDGVTIAKRIRLENHHEDVGAQLIQEASIKTNDTAGDGTTTACVLVQSLVEEGLKVIESGVQPLALTDIYKQSLKDVLAEARQEVEEIKDKDLLSQVATISCRDETVGKVVAELLHKLGPDSYVTLEDFPVEALIPEQQQGLRVRGMLPSTYFLTNKALQEAVMPISSNGVRVIVMDTPLTLGPEAVKIMRTVFDNFAEKEAVVIAPDFGNDALATIIQNWESQQFKLLPMKVIAYGTNGEGYMRDICAVTGGEYISSKDGRHIMELQKDWLGAAEKVICTFHELAIIGGFGDSKARIKELTAQLLLLREFEADSARERIAKLKSKIATIKVGSDTDSERETKKYLVEDAINACRAALRGGIIPGGGATLYRASRVLNTQDPVQRAFQQACEAPLRQLAKNSEVNLSIEMLDELLNKDQLTIDFRTGQLVESLKAGIVDPFSVLESALTNAVSMACAYLRLGGDVVPVYEEE